MPYLQWSFWIIGLGLQFLVILAFLGGTWRDYKTSFFYSVFLILSTIADIVMEVTVGTHTRTYVLYFWIAELLRQTGLYAVVVSLVLHAIPNNRLRAALVRLLVCLAVIFWAGSLWIHQGHVISLWMSKVVRNLSFCSSIANLVLWFVLIAAEKKDTRLLMATGGLGLQMTGDAIGQSLRQLSRAAIPAGNIIIVVTHFICLYIWWKAFQTPATPKVISGPAPAPEELSHPIPDGEPHQPRFQRSGKEEG